jgi:hypothetical protein
LHATKETLSIPGLEKALRGPGSAPAERSALT